MKIKKLALFSIFILISINIYAQVPGIQWKKCLGGTGDDRANYIKQTSDGGFIIAGQTNSNNGDVSGNHGGYDSWIVKLSNSGDIEWKKCLGGNGTDVSTSIQQTNDGGFIVAGYTSSNDSNVSGNHGGYDYWIVKLSNSGDIEWQKCLGGENDDRANSIQQTNDGGYIVAGRSASIYGDVSGNHCGYDYWIVKLNSLGDIEWQKCLGGNGPEVSTSIQQTNDGGYIVAGYTFSNNSDVSGNHGGDDYWIVKLNNSGDIEWRKCYGGTHDDYAKCIQQTNDGGFIVAGYTLSNDGDVSGNHDSNGTYYDGWIVKLNNLGDIEWQKCLGGTNDDYATYIQQTSDGGFIVAGYTDSNDGDVSGNHGLYGGYRHDYWIVKLSNSGDIEWQKCLGGTNNDYATCIQQTNDGGFIVGGYACSNNGDVSGNHGTNDAWIVKLAPMLIVDAGPDGIICNGDSIAIGGAPTASGCIPPYTYLWNNSESLNDSTIANPIAFPNITTTYTLTVTDSIGNINTDSVTITVNNVYFITETDTVCGGKLWHGNTYSVSGTYYDSLLTTLGCDSIYVLNLTVNPTYEFTSYDTICQGDVYSWHGNTYSVSGTYYDSLLTTLGCDSIYVLNLTVNSTYEFTSYDTICQGDLYSWHGNTYSVSGTYYDSLLTTLGCDSIYVLNLTVDTIPTVDTASASETTICSNNPVTLTLNSYSGNLQWMQSTDYGSTWSEISGAIDTPYVYNATTTGIILFHAKVFNICGSDSSNNVSVTVNPAYEFTSYDTICQGDVYLWHGNYYNLSGIYYDSLITINNCDSVYNLNLFVNPLPYINLGNDTTINISDTININAGSEFNSYLWSNGYIDSIITVYGSMGQGIYTYYVTVTDINGCSNSDTIIITITTEDGYIELNNTIKVNIYPNPVQDKLNIEINGLIDNDLSIEFFDINGEKLLNKNFNNNSDVIYETIDLSNYANGVYFIIIKSSNLIKTEKIIKV